MADTPFLYFWQMTIIRISHTGAGFLARRIWRATGRHCSGSSSKLRDENMTDWLMSLFLGVIFFPFWGELNWYWLIIFGIFLYNDALFGLVSYNDPCFQVTWVSSWIWLNVSLAPKAVQHPSNGASDATVDAASPVEPEADPALKEKEVPRKSALFYVIWVIWVIYHAMPWNCPPCPSNSHLFPRLFHF